MNTFFKIAISSCLLITSFYFFCTRNNHAKKEIYKDNNIAIYNVFERRTKLEKFDSDGSTTVLDVGPIAAVSRCRSYACWLSNYTLQVMRLKDGKIFETIVNGDFSNIDFSDDGSKIILKDVRSNATKIINNEHL
jgi:hypothetical protein